MRFNPFCYGLLAVLVLVSYFYFHSFWAWLLLVNVATLLVYGIDKFAARKSWQRVPEMTLLAFGLVGGWLGAIAAQQLFRHKTQKQPFRTWFMLSVVLNVAALAGWGYWLASSV
ncbi:DUF1294 domain-containing protein [Kluyvera sp. STS39-E]|uniref:DUF1294 domain-containing protein n=1 Tax=Kluyvera sp. STS39-E TaxID=3234748 RepID=UPI0034C5D481